MSETIKTLLEPIQNRLNAATPGPWEAKPYVIYGEQDDPKRIRVKSPHDGPDYNTAEMLLPVDAALIANAPSDLRRLIDAIQGADSARQEMFALSVDTELGPLARSVYRDASRMIHAALTAALRPDTTPVAD